MSSTIYRPTTPESHVSLEAIQKTIVDEFDKDFIDRPTFHVTIASAGQLPQKGGWSSGQIAAFQYGLGGTAGQSWEFEVASLGLLGRKLGETALCLMLDDEYGILEMERHYFHDNLYRREAPVLYKPHITLGSIPNNLVTTPLIDMLSRQLPESVWLDPVTTKPLIKGREVAQG